VGDLKQQKFVVYLDLYLFGLEFMELQLHVPGSNITFQIV